MLLQWSVFWQGQNVRTPMCIDLGERLHTQGGQNYSKAALLIQWPHDVIVVLAQETP